MKLQHVALLGVICAVWLVMSCQTNAPLEPLVGHDPPVLGGTAEPPKPPPPMPKFDNYGECVSYCQDARQRNFHLCLDKGRPANECAELVKGKWDNCVDLCVKNCEAECEEFRQEYYDWLMSTTKYTPNEAAALANAQGEKCKRKCKEPIKK